MFKNFSICHIKAVYTAVAVSPSVINFRSLEHNAVPHQMWLMWLLSSYCWRNPQNNQRRVPDTLNSFNKDTWCNGGAIYSSLTSRKNYNPGERKGYGWGFNVFNQSWWLRWDRRGLRHSFGVCCPHGDWHTEVLLCLLQGLSPFV